MKVIKTYGILIVIVSVLIYIFIVQDYFYARKEVVCKVDSLNFAITGVTRVFQNGNQVNFESHSFYSNNNIKVGDSLVKPRNSMFVYHYRFDSTSMKYGLIHKIAK